MKTRSIRVNEDKYLRLVALAKQKGVMISWMLDRILDRYLTKQKGDQHGQV